MSWTSDNYAQVREYLPEVDREVFDRMAAQGLRVREAAGDVPLPRLFRNWALACNQARVSAPSCHTLRLDYARSLRGDDRG
ncbi:hypothetical protein PP637_gp37 [Arthrobacter phage Persistence]|uniref:Uncharacterized protein n=1 Tax=Arthrobacter phage Persistence TaxID=2836007 RepID=A0A8F3E4H6_9CAUD|nr:hypothetical protein PP637_gp37 [Arthrobacter phage Persistence]QWY79667.1 hypothetical protein SEA_PERSISTENCE_37 [Arthrobacter phage Persistence]